MKRFLVQRAFEIAVVAVCLCVFGHYISKTREIKPIGIINEVSVQSRETISITLKGEVKNPGVYEIKQGTALYDVLYKAGGITNNADLRMYDVTEPLVNSGEVYIHGYKGVLKAGRVTTDELESDKKDDEAPKITAENKCNINTASQSELTALPGIGEVLAKKIIEYRVKNGQFNNIEDIKKVNGIGNKKFEIIKELITTEG